MGNFLAILASWLFEKQNETTIDPDKLTYAIYDPLQSEKPDGRTKDIISTKYKTSSNRLDREVYSGCDTLWKCFKRTVWVYPNNPFLGTRLK